MPAAIDDLTLSQLADGELTPDQMARALLAVLDDEGLREQLRLHLRLREATAAWRSQTPGVELVPTIRSELPRERAPSPRREGRTPSLMLACLMGGVLALAGVWLGNSFPTSRGVSRSLSVVNPAQRELIARVFAFHESVAGPLKGYVADEEAVELATADTEEATARPLAMLLRLTMNSPPTGKAPPVTRDYVVVCRQNLPVTIPLPQNPGKAPAGRLFLSPALDNNEVGLRYSLTMEGQTGPAVIAGRRTVGNDFRSLGEVALGDQNVRVEASAWPLER